MCDRYVKNPTHNTGVMRSGPPVELEGTLAVSHHIVDYQRGAAIEQVTALSINDDGNVITEIIRYRAEA